MMRIYDARMLQQDNTLEVEVCQCKGAVSTCFIPHSAPRVLTSSHAIPVLGGIFGVLCMSVYLSFFLSFIHPSSWLILFYVGHSASSTPFVAAEKEKAGKEGCPYSWRFAQGWYSLLQWGGRRWRGQGRNIMGRRALKIWVTKMNSILFATSTDSDHITSSHIVTAGALSSDGETHMRG